MLEKFKFSLWDIFTFLVTGIIIIIFCKYYGILIKIENVLGTSEMINGVFYIIITYTVGVIYEPISNIVYTFLDKIYLNLPWNKYLRKLKDERDLVYKPKVEEIIKNKYNLSDEKMEIYQVAKLSVMQNDKPNTFMVFLSRFGFYRNLSTLAIFNIIPYTILKFDCLNLCLSIIIILIVFILHLLLYNRAKQFYFYAGNEVYRNFIINN